MFWLDDAVESVLRLDGIITLVDAKNIRRQLQRGTECSTVDVEDLFGGGERPPNEAMIQVAYADRILINKVCTDRPSLISMLRSSEEPIKYEQYRIPCRAWLPPHPMLPYRYPR